MFFIFLIKVIHIHANAVFHILLKDTVNTFMDTYHKGKDESVSAVNKLINE